MIPQELTFDQVTNIWAKADRWSIEDAAHLFNQEAPPCFHITEEIEQDKKCKIRVFISFAKSCAGESLPLTVSSKNETELYVKPIDFLRWAQDKGLKIKKELQEAVEYSQNKFVGKQVKKLRNNQRHRERCRAIAALIWSNTPDLSITEMINQPELFSFGCEEHGYTEKTLRDWVSDLCPSPKPGRPRKK